ncbi:MAG: DUF4258 domain-containing protein [Leptolyngbya sp. Prado105]|nr:DUF4258 domain-containing protein [Leptolyngbya sp. Prado105]
MFEQILQRMQEKIHQNQYVMTLHAEEEMEDDNLSILDIEQAILSGSILERQNGSFASRRVCTTSEWKYRICGITLDNSKVEVIAKLGVTDKVVIITVYLL